MKRIIKILIVLITIFMMSSGLIIKHNIVLAANGYKNYDTKYIKNKIDEIENAQAIATDKKDKDELERIHGIWYTAWGESYGPGEAGMSDENFLATDTLLKKYNQDKSSKENSNKNDGNIKKDDSSNKEKEKDAKTNKENSNDKKQSDIKQFSQSEVIRITDQMQKQIDKLKNENKDYSTLQDIKNEWDEKWNLNGKTTADISPELYSKTQAELNKYGVDITKSENKNGDSTDDTDEDAAEDENDGLGTPGPLKLLTTALDGVVGILFLLPKTIFLISLYTVGQVINLAAGGEFSIESIIFNQAVDHPVEIISIDFFDSNGDSKGNTKALIQQNIATWYVAIRNIAITILVIVAMYIAIRMLLATTSEKKAQYKEILIYWVQSLALIFVLHYIMIGIIAINDALVKSLYKAGEEVITGKNNNIMETLFSNAFSAIKITTSLANTFAYMVLCFVTIMFFISYLKRMMTIAFLITIAPLVTITYSIDKIGDGKSQALNAWLKEFSYTILIQPFHCITYLAIGSIGAKLMAGSKPGEEGGIAKILIGMYFLSFIITSEGIVKKIFGIEANNIGTAVGEAAFIGTVMGKIGQTSKTKMNYTGDSKTNEFLGEKEVGLGIKRKPRIGSSNTGGTSPTPGGGTPPTPGGGTQPSAQQNPQDWYSHYNKDDERREELNNNPNRTQVENNELARNNARARTSKYTV